MWVEEFEGALWSYSVNSGTHQNTEHRFTHSCLRASLRSRCATPTCRSMVQYETSSRTVAHAMNHLNWDLLITSKNKETPQRTRRTIICKRHFTLYGDESDLKPLSPSFNVSLPLYALSLYILNNGAPLCFQI